MLPFNYYSPTRFVYGPDSESEVGELCRSFDAKTVLVHYGTGSVVASGLLDTVKTALEQSGIRVFTLGGVVPNPRSDLVYQGIQLCRENDVDLVLGIGGGSAIDSAKAIAIGSCYEGDFWDLYSGQAVPEKRLKLATVITHPATGTDGSNSSVIMNEKLDLKRGLRSDLNRPDFSVINPRLTLTLPAYQLACGVTDILSHVFERYFTRTPDVLITDELCEALMRSVIQMGTRALNDQTDVAARGNLMWAASIAHVGLLGTGRQEDWSVHALQHELSATYDMAHGAGLAALYPAWMQYHLAADPARFARLAAHIFAVQDQGLSPYEAGLDGIRQLARFYRSIGMPVNLKSADVKISDLPLMAKKVKRNPDGTCGHYLPLEDSDILAVYELAYEWSESSLIAEKR